MKNFIVAPWDSLIKGVTLGVFILIIFITAMFVIFIGNLFFKIGIITLYCSILLFPYLWTPRGYLVQDNKVIVKRLISDVKVEIKDVERWKWTWWGVRLLGSGGLYGYYGFFHFRGTGRVRMYATNRYKLVLVKDNQDRKILISPEAPDKFIQLLQERTHTNPN